MALEELREEVRQEFGNIRAQFAEVKEQFAAINERFEDVDRRFEQIDRRFEQVDHRFEQVDRRFDDLGVEMNRRFDEAWARTRMLIEEVRGDFQKVTDGVTTVLQRLDAQAAERAGIEARLENHEGRLITLESKRPRRRR